MPRRSGRGGTGRPPPPPGDGSGEGETQHPHGAGGETPRPKLPLGPGDFERLTRAATRAAFFVVWRQDVAEDCAGEALLALVEKALREPGWWPDEPVAWVRAAATNEAKDWKRSPRAKDIPHDAAPPKALACKDTVAADLQAAAWPGGIDPRWQAFYALGARIRDQFSPNEQKVWKALPGCRTYAELAEATGLDVKNAMRAHRGILRKMKQARDTFHDGGATETEG